MKTFLTAVCLVCLLAPTPAQLVYEAEDVSGPADAWQKDKYSETKWNLWSTDQDAAKKWSGGIVLQSPRVLTDREKPEDGAPVLHTRITNIPPGKYDVQLKTGRTLGVSLDGTTWRPYTGGFLLTDHEITGGVLEFWVDDRYADAGNVGSGYYDTITLWPIGSGPRKPPVEGFAKERVVERLDRGLVAVAGERGTYLSWRLLAGDPADLAFNVYRRDGQGAPVKLNAAPLTRTTDFLDPPRAADGAGPTVYQVRPVSGGRESAGDPPVAPVTDYVAIKLQGDYTVQKIGLGDLDGDGRYDYVIKQPNANIDPYINYWQKSPDTYKLEGYDSAGRFLWRIDLGWAIERGIWYSPFIVHDFNGDGRAEVAAKIGEGDPRDPDGRVTSGPEWVAVFDGRTGQEIARAPWPDRTGFGDEQSGYNYASRNQLAVAYLDGRTPCLLVLRGTYNTMKVDAWQLVGRELQPLWQYTDKEGGARYRGQGAHFTHAVDLDGDGRDEVLLGSAVIDDNGSPLWSTGRGHPDHMYVGDLDPSRPGLEIYYGMETRQQANGLALVEAATGRTIWGWGEPTRHVHSTGMCADLDPREPGYEMYSCDTDAEKKPATDWLYNASGKLLARDLKWSFGRRWAFWDADPQAEILSGAQIADYRGGAVPGRLQGNFILAADILGDWREEIITSVAGELRIYTTTIPATDRRPCLMQDRLYRGTVAMNAQAYTQNPLTSYCLSAVRPGLTLTALAAEPGTVEVVVAAAVDQPLRGQVTLTAEGGTVTPANLTVELKPGERLVANVTSNGTEVAAKLTGPGLDLEGRTWLKK